MQEESSHGLGNEGDDGRGRERASEISTEDLDEIVARASPARRRRRQLLWAVAVAILTTGAAVGSIVGQGISYRQMRALESISEMLARGGCAR